MPLTAGQRRLKRAFDLAVSVPALVVLSPLIGVGWIAARVSSGGSGIFAQVRVGQGGQPFTVYKLRTMRAATGGDAGTTVTTRGDPRITPTGAVLRKLKLDELPQLWNVARGNMSMVGPRPDVPGWADQLRGEDRTVLDLRPGITGPATLAWRDEERALAAEADPELHNRVVVWPSKVRLNRWYAANWSLWLDLRLIARTALGHGWPLD